MAPSAGFRALGVLALLQLAACAPQRAADGSCTVFAGGPLSLDVSSLPVHASSR